MKFFKKNEPPEGNQIDRFVRVAGELLAGGTQMLAVATSRGQAKMLMSTLIVPFVNDVGETCALNGIIAEDASHPWQREAIAAQRVSEMARQAGMDDDEIAWACWMLLTERASMYRSPAE